MDGIAIATLLFNAVTTLCALYLAFVALHHSAKPRIEVELGEPHLMTCGGEYTLVVMLKNVGHWYARPMAVDVIVYCNFDPSFEPIDIAYGSVQAYKDNWVGKGRMKYLKAKGIKLSHGEDGEDVHVRVRAPLHPGDYLVRVSAYSENGVSYKRDWTLTCVSNPSEQALANPTPTSDRSAEPTVVAPLS